MDNFNCFTVATLTIRYVHKWLPFPRRIADEDWGAIGLKNTQSKIIGYLAFKYLQSFHSIATSNWVLALLNNAEIQRYV